MTTDFRRALARLVPVFMPDLLFRLGRDGQPVFKDFAAAIVPTEFAPGKVFGTGTMKPIDYWSSWRRDGSRRRRISTSRTIQQQELAMTFRFHIPQYLSRRAADWKALGFTETLVDFAGAQRALEILGRRSARRVQELGGGQPIRAIRSAAARASTSASCCASCCAAST